MMNRKILFFAVSAVAFMVSGASFAENRTTEDAGKCKSVPSCEALGYSKNVTGCTKAISCPFDTTYKICLDCNGAKNTGSKARATVRKTSDNLSVDEL